MNWYYVSDSEQKGPVAPADFDRLIQSGTVTGATLVWQEGMADWKPYGELQAPLPPTTGSLDRPGAVCSVCGQIFPLAETIRLDNQPVCASCKPVAMQKLREGVTNNNAEKIRKDHIKHEASVKSIGILYFLAAAFLILAGGLGLTANQGEGVIVSLLFLAIGAAQIWVGIGLRGLKPWARIPTGILSGIGLLGIPVGTLINGYILYLIFSQKGKTVFSEEYKQVIAQTPHVKYKTSIVVWIFLGLLVFLILLGLLAVVWGSHK